MHFQQSFLLNAPLDPNSPLDYEFAYLLLCLKFVYDKYICKFVGTTNNGTRSVKQNMVLDEKKNV